MPIRDLRSCSRTLAQVVTVNPDRALGGVVEPRQQISQGAFAGPAAPHDGQRSARRNMHGYVAQDRVALAVLECNPVELDLAAHFGKWARVGLFLDVQRRIDDLEHPLTRRHRLL